MDAENYAIIKTIVGLARNLDLKVVAEGVETANQHQLPALAGCESAQGYLFAEPMPASAFFEFNKPDRLGALDSRTLKLACTLLFSFLRSILQGSGKIL
jgi:EAL domain-containing protein (putative c-di-GMP-specific phosphodiesterase class I)